MKTALAFTLLVAGAGLTQAAILETISLNLTALNPGSTLLGTFSLSNSPAVGDTASVVLSFSDPSNYSPTSMMSTISIISGTPSGFAVIFSPLTFTNLSGVITPIDTKDVSLTAFAFAKCASFPCTSSGLFEDRSPAVFNSTYTIAPASVPEPNDFLLLPGLLTAMAFGQRLARRRYMEDRL
jgi:hypothetical protein